LYGPTIPRLREAYGVGGGGSALVLSAHFAGAMTGIGWWGLERRLAPRTWLMVAVALLVLGAAGGAVAPAWPGGLGAGFTAVLPRRGACFGAGAVVGPLTLAAAGGYRLPFCAGAALAVVALALTRDLPGTARAPAPTGGRSPLPMVAGF